MATVAKKRARVRRSAASAERTVVYRGIKIAPIAGTRSPIAKAIREGLRTQSERAIGEPTQA
jgi:hypothetical protein